NRVFEDRASKSGIKAAPFRDAFPGRAPGARDPIGIRRGDTAQRPAAERLAAMAAGSMAPDRSETLTGFNPGGESDRRARATRNSLGAAKTAENYSSAVSALVGQTGARAGVDVSRLDQRIVALVNVALSAPVPKMQRDFGAMREIATWQEPANPHTGTPERTFLRPPARGSLFDAAARATDLDPVRLRTDTLTTVSGPALPEAQRDMLADTITEHPTTDAELVVSLLKSQPPVTAGLGRFATASGSHADHADTAEFASDSGTDSEDTDSEGDPTEEVSPPSPEAARNASRIAATALAMTLNRPVQVTYRGTPDAGTETYFPHTSTGDENTSVRLDATLDDHDNITYTPTQE
ncbi:MAG: hypothetical protein ACRDUB_23485, partial [Mycobacterium sp.]